MILLIFCVHFIFKCVSHIVLAYLVKKQASLIMLSNNSDYSSSSPPFHLRSWSCQRTFFRNIPPLIFGDTTWCSLLKVNWSFGQTCCFHVLGRIIHLVRNQHEAGSNHSLTSNTLHIITSGKIEFFITTEILNNFQLPGLLG